MRELPRGTRSYRCELPTNKSQTGSPSPPSQKNKSTASVLLRRRSGDVRASAQPSESLLPQSNGRSTRQPSGRNSTASPKNSIGKRTKKWQHTHGTTRIGFYRSMGCRIDSGTLGRERGRKATYQKTPRVRRLFSGRLM